jgi:hypothetical protein
LLLLLVTVQREHFRTTIVSNVRVKAPKSYLLTKGGQSAMKRKTFFVLIGCLSLIAFMTSISVASAKFKFKKNSHAQLEVLSPRGVIEYPPNLPISPRVTDLAGKTIGLYDNGKTGLAAFLDVVEELLNEKHPTATINRYYGAFDMPDEMAEEIANEVDTFILGVAD